jgi:hypothetical protein
VTTLASGTHIDLDHANLTGGSLAVFKGSTVEAAGGNASTITGKITNAGTLSANGGDLSITQGFANTGMLDANNGHLTLQGAITGTGKATIEGTGTLEFMASSSTSNVAFGAGATGALMLDHSLTFKGTISGLAPASSHAFSNFLAFGDSTIDSGWFPTAIANGDPNNGGLTLGKASLISNAVAAGGTGSPVGFGLMNSEVLANDFGYSIVPADSPSGGTDYAIAGATSAEDAGGTVYTNTPASPGTNVTDPGNGPIGNLNSIKSGVPLPSTVAQIENYLTANGGNADPTALYLIGTGGNDTTFAKDDMPSGTTTAQKQAYLLHQADTLASEIETLQSKGAETIIVHTLSGDNGGGLTTNGNFAAIFDTELFSQLDAAGVSYIKSDLAAMKAAIVANPTKFGLTASTVDVGTPMSTTTSSAFIDFDSKNIDTGWGQWGAPTGVYSTNYAYLRAPNAEYTSLYSDDQHFSTQGQQIEADYDLSLLFAAGAAPMDSIDFGDIAYAFGTTTAAYAGTKSGGTLTVTDGIHTTKLTLSGDYTAANFVTADDGHGGTAVIEAEPSASALANIASSHLLDAHYAGAVLAGMNYAMLDFTLTKAVALKGDAGGVLLSSADVIQTNGTAQTLTNNELIHGGGVIGDAFLTLINSATGIVDADSATNGMMIQTSGHAINNAGTIEATDGGWLRVSHTTITDGATAHFSVAGTNSLIDLDAATINGGIVSVGAGSTLEAVNGTTNRINAAIANSGMLEAISGSQLTVTGAVTGGGAALIGSGGTLEFGAASNAAVDFDPGATGTLQLDHSHDFSGTVAGLSTQNSIDLRDINFLAVQTPTFSGDASGGTLTVTDGTHIANIALIGNYLASTFATTSDHHGGTLITDPIVSAQSPILTQPSHV